MGGVGSGRRPTVHIPFSGAHPKHGKLTRIFMRAMNKARNSPKNRHLRARARKLREIWRASNNALGL